MLIVIHQNTALMMINRTKLQSLTSDTRNTPQALDDCSRTATYILNILDLTTNVKHISL